MFDYIFSAQTAMFLITAVVFTFYGRWTVYSSSFENVVSATIDSLIADGYLKTRGLGRDMEILKHTEWCEKDVDT